MNIVMMIITLGRVAAMLTFPVALLVAAIEWIGPGWAWPMGPTIVALLAALAYVLLSLLFATIWALELRWRGRVRPGGSARDAS